MTDLIKQKARNQYVSDRLDRNGRTQYKYYNKRKVDNEK